MSTRAACFWSKMSTWSTASGIPLMTSVWQRSQPDEIAARARAMRARFILPFCPSEWRFTTACFRVGSLADMETSDVAASGSQDSQTPSGSFDEFELDEALRL